jgi:hypothetical protein
MIIVYKTLSEQELRDSAAAAIPKIETFFVQNPKRRVCRTELWYGRTQSIKKKNIAEQINAIVDGLIAEGKTKESSNDKQGG